MKRFYQDTLILTSLMSLGSIAGKEMLCLGMKLQHKLQHKRYMQDTNTMERKNVHQSVATWQVALVCNKLRGIIREVRILWYTWPNTEGLMTQ